MDKWLIKSSTPSTSAKGSDKKRTEEKKRDFAAKDEPEQDLLPENPYHPAPNFSFPRKQQGDRKRCKRCCMNSSDDTWKCRGACGKVLSKDDFSSWEQQKGDKKRCKHCCTKRNIV